MRAAFVAIAIVGLSGCLSSAVRPAARAGAVDDEDVEARGDEDGLGVDDHDDDDDRDGDAPDRDEPDRHDLDRDAAQRDDHNDRGAGRGDDHRQLERRRVGSAPSIAEVLAAAYAASGLGGRLPGHFALRARLGGLVPWVSIRTGRDASWHDEDPDVGRGTTLEVRATWRLDRLVFDGRELQVVALEAARRRERRRLATLVIRTYFAWKRSGSRSRAEEAAAELDALTSGWFSEARRRTASEVRTVAPSAATP